MESSVLLYSIGDSGFIMTFFYPNQQAIPSSHFLLYQSGDQETNIETTLNYQFDLENN